MYDLSESANLLNDDLKKILERSCKWKMLFHPDIAKQVQEVNFSHKNRKSDHLIVFFNEMFVAHISCQKHLG